MYRENRSRSKESYITKKLTEKQTYKIKEERIKVNVPL
jgi:hypothetical protein